MQEERLRDGVKMVNRTKLDRERLEIRVAYIREERIKQMLIWGVGSLFSFCEIKPYN
jgi:hypothetical protein